MLDKKPLPHCQEAEQAVLGAILLHGDLIDCIDVRVSENDFYFDINKLIYRAMLSLRANSKPIDTVTVLNALKISCPDMEIITLLEYANSCPTIKNIAAYADIVRERSILRELISVADSMLDDLKKGSKNSKQILDEAEARVKAIHLTEEV